jgi:hypothetical protein
VLQTGFVESLQSVLERQLTQTFFVVSQTGFVESVQSPLLRHATHSFVEVLQTGVLPEQAPLHGSVVAIDDEPPIELDSPPEPAPPLVVPASPPLFKLLAPPSGLHDLVLWQLPASSAQLAMTPRRAIAVSVTLRTGIRCMFVTFSSRSGSIDLAKCYRERRSR